MNLQSDFKLRRFLFVVGTVLTLAVGIFLVTAQSRNKATIPQLSMDMFPANLTASLKEEIELRLGRLRQNPTAGSWGSLGELCVAHKLLPQAESCFRNASSLAPENPKWVYQLAVMAEKVDLARAIELYHKVLSLDRSVVAVHYHLGRALARIGRFSEAEQSLKTALEMSQRHPLVLKAVSQLRVMQGDGEEAIVLIREAANDNRAGLDIVEEAKHLWMRQTPDVEIDPSLSADANANKPPVTEPLPEPWMEGVASRFPNTKDVGLRAGELESQQQFNAARAMYERLMRMQERNSRAHTAHAMVLAKAGNAQQALEEMKKVCEEFPHDALVFTSRGTIEAQLEDIPAAIRSFEEAVRIKPDFVDAHRALLLLFQMQKMTERIDQEFKTLLSLVPTDEELHSQYSEFQMSGSKLEN